MAEKIRPLGICDHCGKQLELKEACVEDDHDSCLKCAESYRKYKETYWKSNKPSGVRNWAANTVDNIDRAFGK